MVVTLAAAFALLGSVYLGDKNRKIAYERDMETARINQICDKCIKDIEDCINYKIMKLHDCLTSYGEIVYSSRNDLMLSFVKKINRFKNIKAIYDGKNQIEGELFLDELKTIGNELIKYSSDSFENKIEKLGKKNMYALMGVFGAGVSLSAIAIGTDVGAVVSSLPFSTILGCIPLAFGAAYFISGLTKNINSEKNYINAMQRVEKLKKMEEELHKLDDTIYNYSVHISNSREFLRRISKSFYIKTFDLDDILDNYDDECFIDANCLSIGERIKIRSLISLAVVLNYSINIPLFTDGKIDDKSYKKLEKYYDYSNNISLFNNDFISNHAFEYAGALVNNEKLIDATNMSKIAYKDLKYMAISCKKRPYHFLKGNVFEFIEGAKAQVASAEKGYIYRISPVTAANGEPTALDDFRVIINGERVCYQAKVSDDPDWIIEQFSQKKYCGIGMKRITTSDMYKPVLNKLIEKKNNGTMTKGEYDTLINLKRGYIDPVTGVEVTTSNNELRQFQGKNDRISIQKLEKYINVQQNKSFLKECINNTANVTICNAISRCVISSVSNVNKYMKGEISTKIMQNNIATDVSKSIGQGLLSSSVSNGFKFIGYKDNIPFLKDNLNSLVLANGIIDLGKAYIMYKQNEISFNDFLSNIIVISAMTTINIGLNFVIPTFPFVKLVSSIVLNWVCLSFIKNKRINKKEVEMLNLLDGKIDEINEVLMCEIEKDESIKKAIIHIFEMDIDNKQFSISVLMLINSLGLEIDINKLEEFERGTLKEELSIIFGK